jgi:hypothetical protein
VINQEGAGKTFANLCLGSADHVPTQPPLSWVIRDTVAGYDRRRCEAGSGSGRSKKSKSRLPRALKSAGGWSYAERRTSAKTRRRSSGSLEAVAQIASSTRVHLHPTELLVADSITQPALYHFSIPRNSRYGGQILVLPHHFLSQVNIALIVVCHVC